MTTSPTINTTVSPSSATAVKSPHQSPSKNERPPRPEISEAALQELEELFQQTQPDGLPPQGEINPGLWHRLGTQLVMNAEALLLDARHRRHLMVKLRQTRDKSNRRRSQLRQQNKTIEVQSRRLELAMGNMYDTAALLKEIKLLKLQVTQEQTNRRRAEDELYAMKRFPQGVPIPNSDPTGGK